MKLASSAVLRNFDGSLKLIPSSPEPVFTNSSCSIASMTARTSFSGVDAARSHPNPLLATTLQIHLIRTADQMRLDTPLGYNFAQSVAVRTVLSPDNKH